MYISQAILYIYRKRYCVYIFHTRYYIYIVDDVSQMILYIFCRRSYSRWCYIYFTGDISWWCYMYCTDDVGIYISQTISWILVHTIFPPRLNYYPKWKVTISNNELISKINNYCFVDFRKHMHLLGCRLYYIHFNWKADDF